MQWIRTKLWQRVFVGCAVTVWALLAVAPAPAQDLSGVRPAALPGSTPAVDGADRYHLSPRDFDEALAYYTREIGEPMSAGHDVESGRRWAVFAYRAERQPNKTTLYTCVRVREGNAESAVPSVFRELRGAVHYGHLTLDRYDEIAAEYAPVSELFFRPSEELGGPDRTVDAELLRRYRNFVQIGMWFEPEMLEAEIMRIARSGDEEALERLQKMLMPDIARAQELQTTAAIVDHWLECLDEIRALSVTDGFRLEIDLEHLVLLSDDGHG